MKCSQCGEMFPEDQLISLKNHMVCALCKPMFLQKAEEGSLKPRRRFKLASRGVRLVAAILDVVVALFFMAPSYIFLFAFDDSASSEEIFILMLGLGFLAYIVWNIVLLHLNGQTVGKKIMQIKVVYRDNSRIGFWGIFLKRYLIITLLGIIPFVSWIDVLMIFRDNKACLHDDIAQTKVVKVASRGRS